MNISQLIFRHIARRQPAREVAYPDFAKVRSVLIIYPSEWQERNPAIRAMATQLRNMGKQVTIWGYVDKDKPTSPILPDSRVFGSHDYTIWGTLKTPVLQDVQNRSFDLLIDLTLSPLLPLQYIALYTSAKFRIGTQASGLNDMVIQTPPSATPDYLFTEIIHYLKIIKSAD